MGAVRTGLVAVLAGLAVVGCDGDDTTPPPPTPTATTMVPTTTVDRSTTTTAAAATTITSPSTTTTTTTSVDVARLDAAIDMAQRVAAAVAALRDRDDLLDG